jgi:hypothetical protein
MIHSSHAHTNQLRAHDIAHIYEDTKSGGFTLPGHGDYEPGAANVAHTRSLGFLKRLLNGPYFDLEAIWDEHTLYEFGERDVAKTMNTMVEEPYVNHVPTVCCCFVMEKRLCSERRRPACNMRIDTINATIGFLSNTPCIDALLCRFIPF